MSNNNNSNNKKYFKKTNYGGGHDLSSCRGASIILGTCDAAKEREASRELVNLFSGLIDEKFPNSESSVENTNASSSIAELLKLEAENVRERKHHSQSVVSINTNIKGIILIKIIRDDLCPVDLTKILFDRVKRDKLPCCRYSIRLIPLQRAFFPDETEFASNAKTVFSNYLPNAAESEPSTSEDKTLDVDEPASKRFRLSENKIRFQILFKARNHNVLNRETVFRIINGAMHPFGKGDYLHPEVVILAEAFKNLCGISWVSQYSEYSEFNIRKFQELYASTAKAEPNKTETSEDTIVINKVEPETSDIDPETSNIEPDTNQVT